MKNLFNLGLLSVALLFSINSMAANIDRAKAAELACHRVERLVTLKKIDETFLNQPYSILLEPLNPATATDPAFKLTVSQYPGANGTKNQLYIFMDIQGNSRPFTASDVVAGSPSQNAPTWPVIDATTLTENALHEVLEGWQANAEIKPFYTGFSYLTLTQVTVQGVLLAQVEMHSSETANILEVYIKAADGKLQSLNVIKP